MKVTEAVACGATIQVTDVLLDQFKLPGHPVLWLFVLAFAGLPLVIALGWKYDLTAEGMRLTDGPAAGTPEEPVANPDWPVGEGQVAAVAVLPFENLTPNTPRGYLANAIPIELQSQLSRIHDLRVVSRQSAVARAENRSDLPTIARWLETFLWRFFGFAQFKRSALPNGPKVSAGGALSPRGDWRAPSDATAAPWLDELRRSLPPA